MPGTLRRDADPRYADLRDVLTHPFDPTEMVFLTGDTTTWYWEARASAYCVSCQNLLEKGSLFQPDGEDEVITGEDQKEEDDRIQAESLSPGFNEPQG